MNRLGKSAIFIDGSNLYATAKALGIDIDFRRLLEHFKDGLLRAYYYTAIIEEGEVSTIRPLVDWLEYNGFTLVTKPTKEFVNSAGQRKIKGNMDVEMAVDAMEVAPYIDNAILFTGDGDFKHLVLGLQRRGVSVTVVSSIETQPAFIADELRRAADTFVDLTVLAPHIKRVEPRTARLSKFSDRS